MKRFYNIIKHFLVAVLLAIVCLYLLLYVTLSIPAVQSSIKNIAENELEKVIGSSVDVDKLTIQPFNIVMLSGVSVSDPQGNRIITVDKLGGGINLWRLMTKQKLEFTFAEVIGLNAEINQPNEGEPLNIQFLIDAFKSKDPNKPKSKFDFKIHSVILRKCNVSFDRLWQPKLPSGEYRFDANHVKITNLRADVSLPRIANDFFDIDLRRLSFDEQSGFSLSSLKGRFLITTDVVSVKDICVKLPNSEICPSDIVLPINGLDKILNSLSYNEIGLNIEAAKITPTDLKSFLPVLSDFRTPYFVSINAKGNLRNVNLKSLAVSSANEDLTLMLSGEFYNPDSISNFNARVSRMDFNVNSGALSNIISHIAPVSTKVSEMLSRCGNVSLNAKATANSSEISFDGVIATSLGEIDIDMGMVRQNRGNRLNGVVSVENFSLGELLSNSDFGLLSTNVDVNATIIGKDVFGSVKLLAPLFTYKNYNYNNIELDVTRRGTELSGLAVIDDENIAVSIEGVLNLAKENSQTNVSIDFSNVDLYALNMWDKYPDYAFAGNVEADFSGNNIDNFLGAIRLSDFEFTDSSHSGVTLDELSVEADNSQITLTSDILSAYISGTYDFRRLPSALKNILSNAVPSLIVPDESNNVSPTADNNDRVNVFDYNIVIKSDNRLTEFFNLPIGLVDDVVISGHFDETLGNADLTLSIPRLRQGKKNSIIRDSYVGVNFNSSENIYNVNVSSRLPGKNGDIFVQLDGSAANNIIDADVSWLFDRKRAFKGDISLSTMLSKDEATNLLGVDLNVNRSKFFVNDTVWTVEPAKIHYSDKSIKIDNVRVWRDRQYVSINGAASTNPTDSITIDLQNMNLDYVFETLKINHVNFGGVATGKLYATNVFSGEPIAFTPGLNVKALTYNKGLLGDAVIESRWVNSEKKVEIKADIDDGPDSHTIIDGGIWVTRDSLGFDCYTKKVNISFLKPFLAAFSSDIEGRASGHACLYGTFKDIDLVGDIYADTIRMRVDYTNTYYSGSDSVILRPGRIDVKNFKLYDKYKNTAMLNGWVTHKCFRQPEFMFKVTDAQNFLSFDTNAAIEEKWYGTIFGNGFCTIDGKPGVVNIGVEMATAPHSHFTFVLTDRVTAVDYQFLTFSDKSRSDNPVVEAVKEKEEHTRPSIFNMDLRIVATPDALMTLVMDPVGGDKIQAYGEGGLNIGYSSVDDKIAMTGVYTLDRGTYNFTLQDIIIKEFRIRKGSKISFEGDPFKAILDIDALYRINTNLSDLDESFSTDKDLNRTNVPVDAVLKITGQMTEPNIGFDIELPTLTQDVVRKVKSIISTDDMMNRQMIYLLALNRFYTPEYMGGASNNNELASVASSTISSQLSNMLAQLTNNLRISPYFRTDKGDFSDMEVDVALSSTLLNNRLLLNGNFGYRDRSTSSTTFIGDFDIEYLLNRQGTIRLKAYNHFNDQNYYLKSALTTQGVGVIFKHDFDRLFDFLKKKPQPKVTSTDSAPTDSVPKDSTTMKK